MPLPMEPRPAGRVTARIVAALQDFRNVLASFFGRDGRSAVVDDGQIELGMGGGDLVMVAVSLAMNRPSNSLGTPA